MDIFSAFTNFDWSVFQLVEKLWNPVLDAIMIFITHLGDDGIFWIALGLILCVFKKTRKYGVLLFLGLAFATVINNLVLKLVLLAFFSKSSILYTFFNLLFYRALSRMLATALFVTKQATAPTYRTVTTRTGKATVNTNFVYSLTKNRF